MYMYMYMYVGSICTVHVTASLGTRTCTLCVYHCLSTSCIYTAPAQDSLVSTCTCYRLEVPEQSLGGIPPLALGVKNLLYTYMYMQ